MLSENALMSFDTANGIPATVSICGRYAAMSRSSTLRLPCMKLMENMTVRNAVSCGNRTSRKGTAAKLSFSDSHRKPKMTARSTAFPTRKADAPRSRLSASSYAMTAKNITGPRARSPMTFVQSAAEMLRLRVRFLSSSREIRILRGFSPVIP